MTWIVQRLRWAALVVATVGLPACVGIEPDYAQTGGELGHGVFRWGCTTDTDTTCATGSFPDFIAVGAHFSLGFVVGSDLPDEVEVEQIIAASPKHLDGIDAFDALAAGDVTVVAMGRDYTIDMLTLSLRPITEVGFEVDVPKDEDDAGWVVEVGGTATIEAVPRWLGTPLSGALSYDWSFDGAVIDLRTEGGIAYAVARTEGEATVEVTVGGHTATMRLRVVEATEPPPTPDPDPDPGSTGIDGLAPVGADSGSEDAGSGSEDSGSGSDSGGSDDGGTDDGGSSTGGQR